MQFKPFNQWIVMKPIAEATQTASGLFIPHQVAKQYARATIVALPDIPEVSKFAVGSTVFYDILGEVRVGRSPDEIILVSYKNVLGEVIQ